MQGAGWAVVWGVAWVVGCSTAEKQPNPPSGGTSVSEPPSAGEASSTAPSAPDTASPGAASGAASSGATSPGAASPSPTPKEGSVALGNPASDVCVAASGKQETVNSPEGELGVCVFADGSRCEVWRLRRKECTAGSCRNPSGICDGEAR